MKTISITWKNSQKALRASSTFLKVGTFVGLNLAGMGINAVHAAPHTHGEGKLQILQAGSEWQFVLQLPAADVLGFEYAPSTTSEKKRYEETQKVFQRFDDIFTLSNTCELLDTTLESPWEIADEHDEIMEGAQKQPDGSYILNGAKNFITHGSVGDIAVIIAMSAPNEPPARGASAFVLDKAMDGFSASKKENKLGMRCSDTSSLVMEEVRVPGKNLIGEEGAGFRQALSVLDGGRISIAALSVGLAQGALDASIKYANERSQFGNEIARFQGIQFKLAQMATDVAAARQLTWRAAWLRDAGEPYGLAASQAKLFASEAAVRCAEESVQIHGGYGYIKEYPVEKYYRDAKLLTIGEGTSEIQKIVIARHLLSS